MFLITFGFILPRSEHHEEIQQIEIPVQYKDLNDGEIKFRREKWPFLDPHSIVSFLFGPAKLSVPAEHVREYWQHHARFGETWAERCDDWSRIPLGLFGDSARLTTQYGKVVQLVGIFMNIILWRPSSVRASRFLLFTIAESQLWSYYTLNTVYRRICWSMNTLWEGVHPLTGVYGGSFTAKNGIQRWAKHYTKQRQVCCDRDPGGLVMAQESFPFSGDIMEWNKNVSLV